jgi:hypothetical protein
MNVKSNPPNEVASLYEYFDISLSSNNRPEKTIKHNNITKKAIYENNLDKKALLIYIIEKECKK